MDSENPEMDEQENTAETQVAGAVLVENRGADSEEVTIVAEEERIPNVEGVEALNMEAETPEQAASAAEMAENTFEGAAAESSEAVVEVEEDAELDEEAADDTLVEVSGEEEAEGEIVVEAAEETEEAPVAEEADASDTETDEAEAEAEVEETLAVEEQAEVEAETEAETLLMGAAEVFQEALSEIEEAVATEEEARAEAEAGATPEAVAEIETEAAVEIEEAAEELTEAEVFVEAAVEVIAEAEAASDEPAIGFEAFAVAEATQEASAEAGAEEAAEEAETEAEGQEEAVEEPVSVAGDGKPTRRTTSALILDQVLVAPVAAEAEGAARDPVTYVAHKFIAVGPNRQPRVLVYHYNGRTGQPLHNVPVLLEASRAAHFFHQKATSGQTDGCEVLVRIPEEHTIIIMAGDGDVISVHEEVARVIFPVIAQQRTFWEAEQQTTLAHHHEAPSALSFDDWE